MTRARKGDSAIEPVPASAVDVTDAFWAPRLEVNRTVTLPHSFRQCEATNRVRNFEAAGGLIDAKFDGIYFNDSDLYKVVEAAAHSLARHPDDELDAYVDGLIAKFAAAQEDDGYLNTYFTLVEPDKKWTNLADMHELYCAGHLIEAAVAHHRATGKSNLLDVAVRFADHIDGVFGPGKRSGVPGHEEIELALVKLYELTNERRYLDLAAFFIDERGANDRAYAQDHAPVREQDSIEGHAVRAMYLYAAVADIVRHSPDPALLATLDRIWDDVALGKTYITGAVGPSAHNEGFTVPYDLPNDSAYAETCAAIATALWNHRMFRLHGDGAYMDVVEQSLYNGFLSGISLAGDDFFYVNPLGSHGHHHRQPWFGCACCPSNVVRFVPRVPGYIYATSENAVWVNLFVGSRATMSVGGQEVELIQETDYPWDGRVRITVNPAEPATYALHVRVPGWCSRQSMMVPDRPETLTSQDGYVRIEREWQKGDVVEIDMPMPVDRIVAHPQVKADRGRVALRRGPITYCAEGVDNGGSVRDIALPRDARLASRHEPDLLGGVTVVTGPASRRPVADWDGHLYRQRAEDDDVDLVAIPYYAWDNRDASDMTVWFPETTGLAQGRYAPSAASDAAPAASHVNGHLEALTDGIVPDASDDASAPRFTWWDRKGAQEWVSLTFPETRRVSGVEVYWFADGGRGQCHLPESWEVEWSPDGDDWRPVEAGSGYGVHADILNRVTFEPVDARALRLSVQLREGVSAGILEWRVV
ncbi:glycoside hydrolase family 127 protein [Candidatus Poribacteria bacterium]|jgi:uncharacterized protein|nr:glycoside hydrolase family 127 protein [Candidatus Poribacteria bacterium]MBT5535362.1 glycoside hydrolase family 127 protein [Candidatus Poribacteria bacterium]MBT5711194.1 glycoside hydrolase family 127 protein [Candidatus Poribacteria bacterium]MBT7098904.1 glycoside hydrolase family 127 protein [Candidatus Poribacteria bacterium]MBT7804904.1 glycoside hydrolase family 127 protein [Candidatus Poribacteria bacterium]